MIRYSYEVPNNISKAALRVLRHLKKYKFTIFEHDDGNSLLVREELQKIADAIGITYFTEQYRICLIDPTAEKTLTIIGQD